jgi:SSS family transporter
VEGYLVANRSINTLIGGGALASTYSSTTGFLGLLGSIYVFGIGPNLWSGIGILFGFTFSAIFIAPKLRSMGLLTFSQFFGDRYDKKVRTIAALVTFVTMFVYITAQIQGGAYAMQYVLGVPYSVAVIAIGSIFVIYVLLGGSYASVVSSFFQNLMMLAGMVIVALVAIFSQGWSTMAANATSYKPFLFDIWGANGPLFCLSFGLLMGLGVICSPHVSTVYLTSNSIQTAKRISASAVTYLAIFYFCAYFVGTYIASNFRDLQNADFGYFYSIEALPEILIGLFVAAVLAAAMSTTDAQLISASSAITQDLYQSISGKSLPENKSVIITRTIVFIVGITATLITLKPPSLLIFVLALAQSLMVGSFLCPLILGIWWKKTSTKAALYGMIGGFLVVLLTNPSLKLISLPSPFLPGIFGALTSLVIMIVITLIDNKRVTLNQQTQEQVRS